MRVNFCSMLPWTGAGPWGLTQTGRRGIVGDADGNQTEELKRDQAWNRFMLRMRSGSRRGKRGRAWETWEALTRERLPAPGVQLMDYMGFFYSRSSFAAWRSAITSAWQMPFLDAVVGALDRMQVCDSDAFWIEPSYYSFLFAEERRRYRFVNATAAVRDIFRPAEKELLQNSPIIKRLKYLPLGLGLFWWFLDNATFPYLESFYAQHPLPIFRTDFRGQSLARGSKDLSCRPLDLIARLPRNVASIQLNSAVPNWVFTSPQCRSKLPNASYPWVKHRVVTR